MARRTAVARKSDPGQHLLAVQTEVDLKGAAWPSEFGTPVTGSALSEIVPDGDSREDLIRAGWTVFRVKGAPLDVEPENLPAGVTAWGRLQLEDGSYRITTRRITVLIRESVPADEVVAVAESLGLPVLHRFLATPRLFTLARPLGREPEEVCRQVLDAHESLVEAAEPEFHAPLPPCGVPRDPLFPRQWQLRNQGQFYAKERWGLPGADINVVPAWEVTRGRGVRIAVIDEKGFHAHHEDLQGSMVDGSGAFVEPSPGRVVFERRPESWDNRLWGSHATHCAGLIGARGGNGRGVVGVAPEAGLLLLSVPRNPTLEILARAITYAAIPVSEGEGGMAGVDVISCPFAGPPRAYTGLALRAILGAVRYAQENGRGGLGTACFFPARNAPTNLDTHPFLRDSRIIVVGGTDHRDDVWERTASGAPNMGTGRNLSFVAPAYYTFSTDLGGSRTLYNSDKGTSFATSLAAGVAALVLGTNPNLNVTDLRRILSTTCVRPPGTTPIGPGGLDPVFGHGRLDAGAAVRLALRERHHGWGR